jgi:hypothetical protein
MTSVVEDYSFIAKRLREITKSVPVTDDADHADEPSDDEDFMTLSYMSDAI